VQYLETSFNCPVCETEVHKTKPLANIRSDPTLQELIYKLVPELYRREKRARQIHEIAREKERWNQPSASTEKDLVVDDHDRILVTLAYFRPRRSRSFRNEKVMSLFPTRYLCCPLNLPVGVLKKFILQKFDLPLHWEVDIWRTDESLLDDITLNDIVRIYGIFRERKPLEISFSVNPREEESGHPTSEVNMQKNVQFELREEQNTPSSIAARNILTTTPDPSDDEGSSGENKVVLSNEMEINKVDNDVVNNEILQESVSEVSVNS